MINSKNQEHSSRYDIQTIPLFVHVLSGNEPSVKPSTASAWVTIQHGDCSTATKVFIGHHDSIPLHPSCYEGICACEHYIGRCLSQLKPCYFAKWFVDHLMDLSEADAYVLHGVYYGFPIVDSTLVEPYFSENYDSITTGEGYEKMSERIETELLQGKISETTEPVHCVHALGAIFKSNGSIRPITDCKRPLGLSINNSMSSSCYTFKYSNIDSVCEFLQPNDYLCVIDISNAYRSVNIFPPHVFLQAFTWKVRGETKVYLDHCLCFDLKSAPYIFTKVGDYIVKCLGFLNIT